jgi:hypothetical protein
MGGISRCRPFHFHFLRVIPHIALVLFESHRHNSSSSEERCGMAYIEEDDLSDDEIAI